MPEEYKLLGIYNTCISIKIYRLWFRLSCMNFRFRQINKFVLFVPSFFYLIAIHAEGLTLLPQEELAQAYVLEPLTAAEIEAFLGEDPYICKNECRGTKVSTKRVYVTKGINQRNELANQTKLREIFKYF